MSKVIVVEVVHELEIHAPNWADSDAVMNHVVEDLNSDFDYAGSEELNLYDNKLVSHKLKTVTDNKE